MELLKAMQEMMVRQMQEVMDANQAKADAHMQEIMERQIGSLASRMDTNHEKRMAEIHAETEAIRARTKAMHEKRMEANFNICQKETIACQETTEANREKKEPSLKEIQSIVERRKVPVVDAVVKPVRGQKRRQRGQHLAAGQHEEPKKLTQGDCGSQGMLVAACRKVSRRAAVTWCKRGVVRKNWISAKVTQGTWRTRTCQ
jgi:hypothetical protein